MGECACLLLCSVGEVSSVDRVLMYAMEYVSSAPVPSVHWPECAYDHVGYGYAMVPAASWGVSGLPGADAHEAVVYA